MNPSPTPSPKPSPKPTQDQLAPLRADALAILLAALAQCDITKAMDRHLRFEGKQLLRQPSAVLQPIPHSLERIKKLQVIALGKAANPMLDALMAKIPERFRVDGVCSAQEPPARRHRHIRYFQGGHPLPNEDSLRAALAALELLGKADRSTFIFFLVSGGGSSLMEATTDPSIPLEDLRAFYETLVLCGASIAEINIVRKFFSAIKGGQLAQAAPLSEKFTLLLADVPLRNMGIVASSPTLPDHSTWKDCVQVMEQWQLLPKLPATIRAFFEELARIPPAPLLESTPEHSAVDVLLSNHDLVNAARDHARSLGYKVVIDNSCDNWPFERASAYLLERFASLRAEWGKVCLLSGGEVSVQVGANSTRTSCGGRNQHFALDSALRMHDEEEAMVLLSAGSDGQDGNSPAAGALADPTTVERAQAFRFDPQASLAQFNTCPLFTALGDAIVTGRTGNNLRDLRILLSGA